MNPIDTFFLDLAGRVQAPFPTTVALVLTALSDKGLIWIALGLGLLIFRTTRKLGCAVLLSLAVSYLLGTVLLKFLISRPRPYEVFDLALLVPKPYGSSFPSGHTLSSFSAATAIFAHHRKAGIAALVGAFLVACSRWYLRVHFLTDVLGGVAVGVACAILCVWVVDRLAAKMKKPSYAERPKGHSASK